MRDCLLMTLSSGCSHSLKWLNMICRLPSSTSTPSLTRRSTTLDTVKALLSCSLHLLTETPLSHNYSTTLLLLLLLPILITSSPLYSNTLTTLFSVQIYNIIHIISIYNIINTLNLYKIINIIEWAMKEYGFT